MIAKLIRNIDLVELPVVSGVNEYYLPKNVDWAGRKVQQLIVCAPAAQTVSPTDGQTPVLTASDVEDMYVSLYNVDGQEIMHNVHYSALSYSNNNRLMVNDTLKLELCRVKFTGTVNTGMLLLYVIYDTTEVENYELPRQNVTIEFDLGAGKEISFRELINLYIHSLPAKVRAITFWDAENNPAYLTVRDHQLSYCISDMHTALARSMTMGAAATDVQTNPLYLDDLDIDFDYSRIYNPGSAVSHQKITFEF